MNVAIIAAAGQGSRMGGARAKQFLKLAGTPVIFHTLRVFEACDAIQEIVVVVPAPETADFLDLAEKFGLRMLSRVVAGGDTRSESVFRGLQSVRAASAEIVAIHDGVRPLVTAAEIAKTVAAAQQDGAAVLVAPVTDTIKQVANGVIAQTLNRADLRRALTPQCFRYELLCRAYEQPDAFAAEITDESLLVERLGAPITIVEGSSRNIKITSKEDLVIAEQMLQEVSGQ
jgi:2-C-methyl-D-erythritol 4-phosphate cytidylyltransferase